MPFYRRMRQPTSRIPVSRPLTVMGAMAPRHLPAPIGLPWHTPRSIPAIDARSVAEEIYRQTEPATLIRFVGHAPLEATVFEMERLRCNACGQVFTD